MANEPLGPGIGRLRQNSGPGARGSGARALIFTLVALGASAGAAVLITQYVDAQKVTTPTSAVVVAAVDLGLGTTLREEHLKSVDWPQNALPPGALLDPLPVVGRVLVSRVVAGEPLLEAKLASKDARGGLAALIPPTMRAVAVRVDDVVGVAGFIHPEDRVDVIVTMRPPKPSDAEPTSKVILQNVKVLTVGKEIEVKEGARGRASQVTVATLLVDPEQAEKLALAANQGQILLTLRNWGDDDAISTGGIVPSALLSDVSVQVPKDALERKSERRSRRPTTVAEAPAVEPQPAPPPPKDDVVEILRGDRFEQRKFQVKEPQ